MRLPCNKLCCSPAKAAVALAVVTAKGQETRHIKSARTLYGTPPWGSLAQPGSEGASAIGMAALAVAPRPQHLAVVTAAGTAALAQSLPQGVAAATAAGRAARPLAHALPQPQGLAAVLAARAAARAAWPPMVLAPLCLIYAAPGTLAGMDLQAKFA
jgi:hypothetical protein